MTTLWTSKYCFQYFIIPAKNVWGISPLTDKKQEEAEKKKSMPFSHFLALGIFYNFGSRFNATHYYYDDDFFYFVLFFKQVTLCACAQSCDHFILCASPHKCLNKPTATNLMSCLEWEGRGFKKALCELVSMSAWLWGRWASAAPTAM